MIRTLALILALGVPAQAETARVISGEHADFTRLVIELPRAAEWTVGRRDQGYGFATRTDTQPAYDLSSVWQRIPRSRLADLTIDPVSGSLSLVLGCDCHVFSFDYANGIVVLDIREGPAPPASVFEAPFALPAAVTPMVEATASYDWLAGSDAGRRQRSAAPSLPLDTGSVSLEPLRDELLEQIAKGAADGLVDMDLPGKPPKLSAVDHAELPWSHVRIGEQPGVTVTNPGHLIAEQPAGAACPDPDILDLPGWGKGRSAIDLMAETRSGLFGEFDHPDADAILRSARVLLYLGFGAEARQHLAMSGGGVGGDVSLYLSLSRLVDGETDPATPFAAMLDCEGPASLWAALAHDRLPAGPAVNRDAVLQAFLGLPAHLRRHLGPALAQKFLDLDDAEAVRLIRDAVERTPDAEPSSVALLDARAELHQGDADAARLHAETAVALDGDKAENLVALVEAHFRKLQPLGPEIPAALQALRRETAGSTVGQSVDRAVVLALALSGQTAAALDAPPPTSALSDLWQVVAARATDDDFLRQAVFPAGAPIPDVSADARRAAADRLLSLGFADAALIWLGPVSPSDPVELRLLAASAQLARRDARAALTLLDGVPDPKSDGLRAEALLQLGDLSGAQAALSKVGKPEAALRLNLWQEEWSDLGPDVPDPWRAAADLARPLPDPQVAGLLGRGGRSLDASLAARKAIEALLDEVPPPDGN
jgi:hypothetical protein